MLLKDHLNQSIIGRAVFTSSAGHKSMAKPDFNDIELEHHYRPDKAYGNSKLFALMAMHKMVEQLASEGSSVTLHAFHPGFVATNLINKILKKVGLYRPWFLKVAHKLLRSSEEGADTLIYLATAESLPIHSGGYYINRELSHVRAKHFTDTKINAIWTYCLGKTQSDEK